MITPDDIRWQAADAAMDKSGVAPPCPVCGSVGPRHPVLQVPSMSPPHPMLTLLHCSACGSRYYDPPGIADFSDLGQDQEEFWRYYVEVGGGVWETIWPTIAERTRQRGTLLDIGCGFGFAVDFWRRSIGSEAAGVELAEYGRLGARMFGIPIYNELLQDCPPLKGRKFDVVYASEVIEHVPDPGAFAALLAEYVADDGLLVLTTPSAEYIERAQHSATLLASLAPGFHGFLLSRDAFAEAARKCGFPHVEVRVFGERQVLWASRRPLRVEPEDPALLRAHLDYLAQRIATLEPSSPVWQGYSYRYLKDLLNAGRLLEAKPVAMALLPALEARFGPAILDPHLALARMKACTMLTEYGQIAPYFLPSLYYFLGALAQHHDRNPELALRYYEGAVNCTQESVRLGTTFFMEAISLVWPARARQGELWLARGELARGVAMFVRIADEGADCSATNAFALAPRDLLETTIPQCCDQMWTAGYRNEVQTLFEAYRRYVERRYGTAALTTSGIDALLVGGNDGLPLSPLFTLYFSGRQDSPVDPAMRDLAAVCRIGEAHARHPVYGRRLTEMAANARRLMPANVSGNPAMVWSFETTYTVPGPRR